jgi:hypothetical protein
MPRKLVEAEYPNTWLVMIINVFTGHFFLDVYYVIFGRGSASGTFRPLPRER